MPEEIKKMYTVDENGKRVNVRTIGEAVTNAQGQTLENVEAGAQVNIIETVNVNGTPLTVTNKAVDITIDTETYTIEKKSTATEGYLASYQLKKGDTFIGSVIDIPKDFLVKSGSVKICETAGVPETTPALAVGDPYLDFVINAKTSAAAADAHIYVNLKNLVDVYTAGNGITITNNQISVNTADTAIADAAPAENSTKFVHSGGVYTALAGKQDVIQDLETIRTGAGLGATAVQPAAMTSALALKQDVIDANNKLNSDYISGNILRYVETLE